MIYNLGAGTLFILFFMFVISYSLTRCYKFIAIRNSILANTNFRTLHKEPTPRGGGIVFSSLFIVGLCIYDFYFTGAIDSFLFKGIVYGGIIAAIFGFIDDLKHIGALTKFLIQGMLSAYAMSCFGGGIFAHTNWLPVWLGLPIGWISFVWLINSYNFIDGIDGMASSGAISICLLMLIVLTLTSGSPAMVFIFALLASVCLGFLLFNWPPASIFMGDSGSVFLGYFFGVMMLYSTNIGDISPFTWIVVFGYFSADTITTTVIRIFKVKVWYGAHRSHAYQNLARIWGSHKKVTSLVLCYHVFWLLPLTIASVLIPNWAGLSAILAFFPAVLWTVRYGPLLSSS